MGKDKIRAEFEILIHPKLELKPAETILMYSLDDGDNWDDYYGNKLGTPKKWQVTMYDMPEGESMSFFIRFIQKDGEIFIANKEGKNYNIELRKNQKDHYKAQIRIRNVRQIGKKCIVCGTIIGKNKNLCPNEECKATYCPECFRMLPPSSNYCPWCDLQF
ncbi:MAG: zinc ribbon domain-containing protein [Promethearchaeia archaeon]